MMVSGLSIKFIRKKYRVQIVHYLIKTKSQCQYQLMRNEQEPNKIGNFNLYNKKKKYIGLKSVSQNIQASTLGNAYTVDASEGSPSNQLINSLMKVKLEAQVDLMFERVLSIVDLEGLNRREATRYVCSSVLFKEIGITDAKLAGQLLKEYSESRIGNLQTELKAKNRELEQLKEEMTSDRQFSQSKFRSNSIFIPPQIGNISSELYCKAKQLNYDDFTRLYKKMHQNRQQRDQFKGYDQKKLLRNIKRAPTSEHLIPLLQNLSGGERQNFIKLLQNHFKCTKPCCRWDDQEKLNPSTSAQLYLSCKEPASQRPSVYQTHKFNEYCSRYCGDSFKLTNVISMSRTKSQEMERMYSKFKGQQKLKAKQHQRNRSIV